MDFIDREFYNTFGAKKSQRRQNILGLVIFTACMGAVVAFDYAKNIAGWF